MYNYYRTLNATLAILLIILNMPTMLLLVLSRILVAGCEWILQATVANKLSKYLNYKVSQHQPKEDQDEEE